MTERNPDGTWAAGSSGNPEGRKSFEDVLRDVLEEQLAAGGAADIGKVLAQALQRGGPKDMTFLGGFLRIVERSSPRPVVNPLAALTDEELVDLALASAETRSLTLARLRAHYQGTKGTKPPASE